MKRDGKGISVKMIQMGGIMIVYDDDADVDGKI